MNGCFITLEGIEGVGKTTHTPMLVEFLREQGLTVLSTREPGGTELGEQVRDLLLQGPPMRGDTELLLMFAARAEHLQQIILPALANGQWVVCDRFTDASYAYQGAGRGVALERIAQLETWVQGNLRPDLTLLLDVDAEIGLQRVRRRYSWEERIEADRFEREQLTFFQKVRKGYLALAAAQSYRYRTIDATLPVEEVATQLQDVVYEFVMNALKRH
ncbi:MAG: dTMP kinase [Beggiatoa sp. IS2]|nr:MAG: dTMP kinase [Beggiatoa sp. IS2]